MAEDIYIYIIIFFNNIQLVSKDSECVLFFIEYMRNIIKIYVSAQCMAIVNPLFLPRDIKKITFRAFIV